MEKLKDQILNLSLEKDYIVLLYQERDFVKTMPASNDIFEVYNKKRIIELTKEIQLKEAYVKVYQQRVEEYKAYQEKITAEYLQNFKDILTEAKKYLKHESFVLKQPNLCQQIQEHINNYSEGRLKDQEDKNNCYLALKGFVAQAKNTDKPVIGHVGIIGKRY